MRILSIGIATIVLSAHAAAQIPNPNPLPRLAPRAEWIVTPGVAGTIPANRHWSPAASNATSLFVFGGRTGTSGTGTKRNDLHEFDASTLTWTTHNADGDPSAPAQRYRNTLAWDPINNRLVMFGGEDGAGGVLGDVWQWDAATRTWTDITPPSGSPPARRFAAMAYDPSTSGMLLFGGMDSAGNVLNDSWLLIGTSWNQLMPGTSPGVRAHHSLVTRGDPYNDVFLCAGHDNGAAPSRVHYTDAWRWQAGSGWTLITPTSTAVPASHAGNQAVYDAVRQRVVLQGGQGISTDANNTGGAYGTSYGGSPTNWTSEYDCVDNEWLLYGDLSFNTGDPVLGRASRYFAGFLPATGKVYLWGGQNPSGVGAPLTSVKEYQANPVADSTPYGNGCSGSGGMVSLVANARPWLGRAIDATVTGLAPASQVFGAIGLQSSTPISMIHPAGGANCDLLVTPVITFGLAPMGGAAALIVPLPNDITFAGVVLHLQSIQFELDAMLNLTLITSSNGLRVTAGAL